MDGGLHRLAAAVNAQLSIDAGGVLPHGFGRDEQLRGDLLVGESLAQQQQHVQLAIAEHSPVPAGELALGDYKTTGAIEVAMTILSPTENPLTSDPIVSTRPVNS